MSLAEKKEAIVEELRYIEDPQERLGYIIDRAKSQEPLDDQYKIDQFLIEGCLSQLWVFPEFKDGKLHFSTDADALITKGIASLIADLYTGATPDEALQEDASFLKDLGVTQHMTPNRRNGLSNLIKRVHGYAEFCKREYSAAN